LGTAFIGEPDICRRPILGTARSQTLSIDHRRRKAFRSKTLQIGFAKIDHQTPIWQQIYCQQSAAKPAKSISEPAGRHTSRNRRGGLRRTSCIQLTNHRLSISWFKGRPSFRLSRSGHRSKRPWRAGGGLISLKQRDGGSMAETLHVEGAAMCLRDFRVVKQGRVPLSASPNWTSKQPGGPPGDAEPGRALVDARVGHHGSAARKFAGTGATIVISREGPFGRSRAITFIPLIFGGSVWYDKAKHFGCAGGVSSVNGSEESSISLDGVEERSPQAGKDAGFTATSPVFHPTGRRSRGAMKRGRSPPPNSAGGHSCEKAVRALARSFTPFHPAPYRRRPARTSSQVLTPRPHKSTMLEAPGQGRGEVAARDPVFGLRRSSYVTRQPCCCDALYDCAVREIFKVSVSVKSSRDFAWNIYALNAITEAVPAKQRG